MKIILLATLSLLTSLLTAQEKYNPSISFNDYMRHQYLYNFEYLTITANDYERAVKHLQTIIKEADKQIYYCAESVRKRLVAGSEEAAAYIDSLQVGGHITGEERLYLLSYTSLVTNNHQDAQIFYQQLLKQHPASRLSPKLTYLFYMQHKEEDFTYKNDSLVNDMQHQFSKLLALPDLEPPLYIFYALANTALTATNEEQQIPTLLHLWKKYPALLDGPRINKIIKDCKTLDCIKLKEVILAKQQFTVFSEDELIDMLDSFVTAAKNNSPAASKIKVLEKKLTQYLLKTQTPTKKVIAQSIIRYANLNTDLLQSSMLWRASAESLSYSASFRKYLQVSWPKDSLLKMIDIELQKFNNTILTEKERVAYKKNFTVDKLSLMLGWVTYLEYVNRKLDFFSWGRAENIDLKNWANFMKYLKRNPLYFDDKRTPWDGTSLASMTYPLLENYDTLQYAINQLEQILLLYPGATALYKNKLLFLKAQNSLHPHETGLFSPILASAMEILYNDQSYIGYKYESYFFDFLKPNKVDFPFKKNKAEILRNYFMQYISEEEKMMLEKKLRNMIIQKPHQQNLHVFLWDMFGKRV